MYRSSFSSSLPASLSTPTATFISQSSHLGGHFVPNITSVVYEKNKEINNTGNVGAFTETNLKSVLLANGITGPYAQFGAVPELLCNGPYPVLDNDGPKCAELRSKVLTYKRLVNACDHSGSRFAWYVYFLLFSYSRSHYPAPFRLGLSTIALDRHVLAGIYCSASPWAPLHEPELNPYDVCKKCVKEEDGQLCYKQMGWIDEWMYLPEVQAELGLQFP